MVSALARPPHPHTATDAPEAALPAFTPALAWDALAHVPDPELPVVSIVELGIVRGVSCAADTVEVAVTPTYSGCPATEVIHADIVRALRDAGARHVRVDLRLAPAWTTAWIAPEAKAKLAGFGIAPPAHAAMRIDVRGISPLRRAAGIACPRCGATDTALVSQFGSTACKAQYRCNACREPFDYLKPF